MELLRGFFIIWVGAGASHCTGWLTKYYQNKMPPVSSALKMPCSWHFPPQIAQHIYTADSSLISLPLELVSPCVPKRTHSAHAVVSWAPKASTPHLPLLTLGDQAPSTHPSKLIGLYKVRYRKLDKIRLGKLLKVSMGNSCGMS